MSRTRKSKHRPRCGVCHPDKLDGNSLKNADRKELVRRVPLRDFLREDVRDVLAEDL